MNYQVNVKQDPNLIYAWFTGAEIVGSPYAELCYEGIYTQAGAPSNIAGLYIAGAIVKNAADGIDYTNAGTTNSPSFVPVGASLGGTQVIGKLLAANMNLLQTAVINVSGISGAFTVGETITGGISTNTAIFISSTSTTMTVSSYNATNGLFTPGETLTGGTSAQTATFGSDSSWNDQVITLNSGNYILKEIIYTNASTSLTTVSTSIRTAPGGQGTQLQSGQALSALVAPSNVYEATGVGGDTSPITGNLYLIDNPIQGGAATCDVFVLGIKLPL